MSGMDRQLRILILDYSVDRSETDLFRQWFPRDAAWTSSFLKFGDPIPTPEGFTHVMHSGSSLSIRHDPDFMEGAQAFVRECCELGIPQMGVCYGHQLLCRSLLGREAVELCGNGLEIGWRQVRAVGPGLDIMGFPSEGRVLQSHLDRVVRIPNTAELIATGDHTEVQGFIDVGNRLMGTQFHPEFTREQGNALFRKSEELLAQNGFHLPEVTSEGPSFSAGEVFFGHFLSREW